MEYDEPLFYRVMQYAARADRDVVDMVSGSPDWEPPAGVREGLREYAGADSSAFQYPPSAGLRELRGEIASDRGVDPGQVIVTNGTGEANYLALGRALDRGAGDEVVLVDPTYPYYPGKVELLGGRARYVEAGPDGSLDPRDVRAAVSEDTAAVVINTPNNPTGAVYDAATLRELVAVAEECDALLISDEVYERYVLDGEFASALAVESDHRVVTSGFSKSLAITGFRVGYAILPASLAETAKTRHMLVNVAASRPAQRAALEGIRSVEADYYEDVRDTLRRRVRTFTDALDAAGADYVDPDGAFYVLARFPGFPGTLENAHTLIDEAGVAGMPGAAFGERCDDWLRFALVTPRVETAAERLSAWARESSAVE